MKRLLLTAALAALLLPAAPSLALSVPAQVREGAAPPALPRALPPIPSVGTAPYPGVIRHHVDATDIERRIVSVRQTIPVAASGPMVLLYPRYLPGNHASTGPIQLVSGLTVTAGGRRVEWLRDTLDPYAFHIDIPEGASEIEVAFQWLTQHDPSAWRVVMTDAMMNLQFEKALLYPAGYAHRNITFQTTVALPQGWNYGVALDTRSFENGVAAFEPTTLEVLADSPMFAGRHFRRIDIDPGGRSPVHLNIVADEAANIAPTEAQLDRYEALVDQADYLFGARHYDRYDFLLAQTDTMGGIGLEHHRSSENTVDPDFFTDWSGASYRDLELLPHEYVHSWNGKYRRPADQMTDNLNQPLQNSLLWVYEGQTQYWGAVLAARSGLVTREEAMANLANIAALFETQAGRDWRALQDTVNQNVMGYRASTPWPTWSRTGSDYYREALLIWLDADTLIREATGGRKSLDDFARAFFGGEDGVWTPEGYTFEELVAVLNGVHPHDWAGFLRERLDAVGPEAPAPLDGIARAGWRLGWTDEPNAAEKKVNAGWAGDFTYSLGFALSGTTLGPVRWGSPAYEAGLTGGWTLVAVNDRAASAEVLREAVTAARGTTEPIRLILRNGDRFRTLDLAYHDGLRYPRLERIAGAPDRLAAILAPRRR